jgi:hypothetical protein
VRKDHSENRDRSLRKGIGFEIRGHQRDRLSSRFQQAVKAAEQIKFKPALHEGQPIDSMAQVHIIFELIS